MTEPHRLQLHALEQLHAHLGKQGRGVVVMPCGSGKTLLGRWFAEQIQAQLTVVFVPSLALVPQTLLAYRSDTSWRHQSMIVCSDESSGRTVGVNDLDLPAWARESVTASTSTRVVGEFLGRGGAAKLIVSTYHSAPRVAAALASTGTVADLVVCDEAHRLTGRPRDEFRAVLREQSLPARRRLFLTATPVEAAAWADDADPDVVAPLSLDDEATFGPTLYRATFAEAVAAGRLVDYDVQVLATRADTDAPNARGSAAMLAVLAAAGDGAARILTFHSRITHARALATALDGHRLADGRVIRAEHLQSAHRAVRRQAALDRLAQPAPGTVRVLASARTLNEGVDVPAVDTVVFAEPRRSPVDIVQAVGRAMRTAPGKRRGRVVLAATLTGQHDEDTELSTTIWRHVWITLRALAEMDPRFATRLRDRIRGGKDTGGYRPGEGDRFGPGLDLTLPEGIDPNRWVLRALDRTGGTWWHRFEVLKAHTAEHGIARPGTDTTRDGIHLGRWVNYQRTARRAGTLAEDRVEALERLPGWAWDARELAWWRASENWARVHTRGRKMLAADDRWVALAGIPGWGINPPMHAYTTLAEFAVDTTSRRRRGVLPGHLERAADRLPCWEWDLLDSNDAKMVDALAEYGSWRGDLNAPHDYLHDDELALGAWLTAIRRRRVTSRLDPLLEYSLEVLGRPSAVTALRWDTSDTKWRLSYLALRQYATRESTCRMPQRHLEQLPDFELDLSRWCTIQRQDRRRGVIDPDRAVALDSVPGWAWEVTPHRADTSALELDPGLHGERAGYAKGCRCDPCIGANAATYEGKRRQDPGTDLVDTTPATRHLRTLLAAGVGRNALGRVSGLNDKTVDDVIDGRRGRIRPETAAALLAITLDVARAADRSGFGPHGELVDAGPTWELIDWMVMRGWPKAWISREIGQDGRALQLKRDRIARSNAEKVAELDRRLGRTRRPPLRKSSRVSSGPSLPTLEQLLASDEAAS